MVYVCYTADSGYSMQVAVSMTSMLENNRVNIPEFFVLADRYPEYVLNRFRAIEKKYGTKIHIIDVSDKLRQLINTALVREKGIVKNDLISFMFARLFVGSSVPEYVSKILYIDCDTLYTGNINELYDTGIGSDYIFAAVRDLWPASYNRAIGLDAHELYFSSGILLIDLDKWRKLSCENTLMKAAESAENYYFMHDQDLLNICFHGKIQTLSPKFGMVYLLRQYSAEECLWFLGKSEGEYYNALTINEAKNDIHMIHFTGEYFGRPWDYPTACADNRLWLKYYQMTDWAAEPLGRSQTFADRCKHIIKFLLYPFIKKKWLYRTKNRFETMNHLLITGSPDYT